MGQAKQRSVSAKEIIAKSDRCVYCASKTVETVEHMPPRGLFEGRDRPSGWEFGCCKRCNEGTRSVDAVAQFFALIEPISENAWKVDQVTRLLRGLQKRAPSVAAEILQPSNRRPIYLRKNGLLHPAAELNLDGPSAHLHLNVFAQKFAMAAFAKLVERPIDMEGYLFTHWFTNSGVPDDVYYNTLKFLPGVSQLQQGKKVSGRQFSVNFNTDRKHIVAAFGSFHGSLSVIAFASDGSEDGPRLHDLFESKIDSRHPNACLARPGLLDLPLKS